MHLKFLSYMPRRVLASDSIRFTAISSGSLVSNFRSRNGRQYTTHSQLPEEHQMIHEMCRKFADEELAPNAGKWDKDHLFPTDAVNQLVSFGWVVKIALLLHIPV